jgi:hypothetical protein
MIWIAIAILGHNQNPKKNCGAKRRNSFLDFRLGDIADMQ